MQIIKPKTRTPRKKGSVKRGYRTKSITLEGILQWQKPYSCAVKFSGRDLVRIERMKPTDLNGVLVISKSKDIGFNKKYSKNKRFSKKFITGDRVLVTILVAYIKKNAIISLDNVKSYVKKKDTSPLDNDLMREYSKKLAEGYFSK